MLPLSLGALGIATASVCYLVMRGHALPAVILAGCACGTLLAIGQALALQTAAQAIPGVVDPVELELVADPQKGDFDYTVEAEIAQGAHTGAKVLVSFNEKALSTDELLMCHDIIVCIGSFAPLDENNHDRLWPRGCCGTIKATSIKRGYVAFPLNAILDARRRVATYLALCDTSPLVSALACGWRQDLSRTSLYGDFKETGLAHLVAISGAHLVIVTALAASALKSLRMPRVLSTVLLVVLMTCYFLLAGAPISALRALAMSLVALSSFTARRRPASLNALALTIIFMISHAPAASLSVSLALSAFSTMGIVLFSRLFESWIPVPPSAQAIVQPFALTIAASLMAMPLSCALFAQLPVVSPLANIACAPLFPLCCAFALLAGLAIAVAPLIASPLVAIASTAVSLMEGLVHLLAQIPHGCLPVSLETRTAVLLSFALAAMLWLTWPDRPRGALKVALVVIPPVIVALLIVPNTGDQLVMFDVGQGDAFLLRSNGATILVDTGNQDASLLRALGRASISRLDALIITHADDDHCGSMEALSRVVDIDAIILARPLVNSNGDACRALVERSTACADTVWSASVGDVIHVGAFSASVVSPEHLVEDGGNADSLCLLVSYDRDDDGISEAFALLTGDAESDVLHNLAMNGSLRDVDILKAPHHGSAKGLSEEVLDVLKPEIALVSCGVRNRYGHPASETLDLLSKSGSTIFRTDTQGDVVCTFTPMGISVSTQR